MQHASVRFARTAARPPVTAADDPVAGVRAVLAVDDDRLDYAAAKLALDRLIDAEVGVEAMMAHIDSLTHAVRRLAGSGAGPDTRLAALRHLLYAPGYWNDDRPFAYDHEDPLAQLIPGKLLATYLELRRGNCVSMPALFLILADRLGLDVALATAPLHVFVRYRSESGRIINIETTSGAHPTRDDWYRAQMPMSDRAVESGLYLRSLSRRESVALLATTVIDHLIEQHRFHEAAGVAETVLRHAPSDAYTMVKLASVCAELIRTEFTGLYPTHAHIPPPLRARLAWLQQRNRELFACAESWGWEPVA